MELANAILDLWPRVTFWSRLSVTKLREATRRQAGVDRKTVRTHIAKGLEPRTYKKRAPAPSIIDRFEPYLHDRLEAYPALTAQRLFREIKERGFSGGYSVWCGTACVSSDPPAAQGRERST